MGQMNENENLKRTRAKTKDLTKEGSREFLIDNGSLEIPVWRGLKWGGGGDMRLSSRHHTLANIYYHA